MVMWRDSGDRNEAKTVKSHLDVALYIWMDHQFAFLPMVSMPKIDNDDSLHIAVTSGL